MGDRPCPPKLLPPCASKEVVETEKGTEDKVSTAPEKPPTKVCKEMWHPGFDARFSNQNITGRCWVNYVDYIRCQEKLGEDERCEYFKKTFTYLCPEFWIENWNDQRENGVFPMPRWA